MKPQKITEEKTAKKKDSFIVDHSKNSQTVLFQTVYDMWSDGCTQFSINKKTQRRNIQKPTEHFTHIFHCAYVCFVRRFYLMCILILIVIWSPSNEWVIIMFAVNAMCCGPIVLRDARLILERFCENYSSFRLFWQNTFDLIWQSQEARQCFNERTCGPFISVSIVGFRTVRCCTVRMQTHQKPTQTQQDWRPCMAHSVAWCDCYKDAVSHTWLTFVAYTSHAIRLHYCTDKAVNYSVDTVQPNRSVTLFSMLYRWI